MCKKYKLPQIYHDLTPKQRREVREQYAVEQNNLCFFCHKPLNEKPVIDKEINWSLFPGGILFLKYPIHLQHCHKTGYTEGAVHSYCNAKMFQYYGR